MSIKSMVAAVQKQTGVGRRKARDLISDACERIDYATDGEPDHTTFPEPDIVEVAVECWRDEQDNKASRQERSIA